jgi:hypothetical protein
MSQARLGIVFILTDMHCSIWLWHQNYTFVAVLNLELGDNILIKHLFVASAIQGISVVASLKKLGWKTSRWRCPAPCLIKHIYTQVKNCSKVVDSCSTTFCDNFCCCLRSSPICWKFSPFVENYPWPKTAKVDVYTRKKLSKKICFENFEEKAFVMTKRWFVTKYLKYKNIFV